MLQQIPNDSYPGGTTTYDDSSVLHAASDHGGFGEKSGALARLIYGVKRYEEIYRSGSVGGAMEMKYKTYHGQRLSSEEEQEESLIAFCICFLSRVLCFG